MSLINRIRKGISRRLFDPIVKNSSFKFLVRDWSDISDIELAQRVLDTEFFRKSLRPQEFNLLKYRKIVVVAPHQDDEAIGAGGLLAKAQKAGVQTYVIFITDGAQDNLGFTPSDSVKVRADEARKACRLVGAEMYGLGVSNLSLQVNREHLDQLQYWLDEIDPEIVMLPWLLDGPVKHRFVNYLMYVMAKRCNLGEKEILCYQVHNQLYPNLYLDISDVIDLKDQMIKQYVSQNERVQCYDHLAMGMAMYNTKFLPTSVGDIQKKYGEIYFGLNGREYFKLVEEWYLQSPRITFKAQEAVLEAVATLNNISGRD